MKEMERFLNMSFLNSERNLEPLFKILNKYHGDYGNSEFTLENIYKALFNKKKFSDKYLTSLMSDLYKTAKYFLAAKKVFDDEVLYNKIISEELLKRNLTGEFEKQIQSANDVLDKKYLTSKNYIHHKEELALIHSTYLDTQNDFDAYISSYLNLANLTAMDSLMKLFRNHSELFIFKQQNLIETEQPNLSDFIFNSINFDELWNNIKGVSDQQIIKLKLFYLCSILSGKQSMPLYHETKELFFNNYELFGREQRRDIFFMLLNFCHYMAITRDDLTLEVFELNKKFLADNGRLYLENNFFDMRLFRNIALNATQLKEYEWVINFINEFKIYLEQKDGDNFENYLLAMAYSRIGDFDNSLEILSRVKFNFGTFKEEILLLKAVVLYEKGFSQEALETLISFKKTFRKTPVMSKDIYLFFKNSITFFIKFLNIVLKQKHSELDFFEQQLNECQIISVKPWLLGKIEELRTKESIK